MMRALWRVSVTVIVVSKLTIKTDLKLNNRRQDLQILPDDDLVFIFCLHV